MVAKYKQGQLVRYMHHTCNVEVVDRFGHFLGDGKPSYDLYCEDFEGEGEMIIKHVPEYLISKYNG